MIAEIDVTIRDELFKTRSERAATSIHRKCQADVDPWVLRHSHSEYARSTDSVPFGIVMLKSLHTDQNAQFLAMLIELRHARRLRQLDLARLLGKSQATVSKVEQGSRRLDLMELRQWLAALDVDFLSFMNDLSSRLASALAAQDQREMSIASEIALSLTAAELSAKSRPP